jgi:hypothetical protein
MCQHEPPCPSANGPDHATARVIAARPEQGWSLLCNGVVVFDDGGELLPDGSAVAPALLSAAPEATTRDERRCPTAVLDWLGDCGITRRRPRQRIAATVSFRSAGCRPGRRRGPGRGPVHPQYQDDG